MELAGDWSGWKPEPAQRAANGVWYRDLALRPGEYRYAFRINGTTWTVPAGSLEFEQGPSADVPLQWATYYDAADQAGISRLYGGIHVEADDLGGRVMGAQCGRDAWTKAQTYWDGTARAG